MRRTKKNRPTEGKKHEALIMHYDNSLRSKAKWEAVSRDWFAPFFLVWRLGQNNLSSIQVWSCLERDGTYLPLLD